MKGYKRYDKNTFRVPRQYLPQHHGSICFQDMVNKAGLSGNFHIDSAATSREEIGNPPHHGTVRKMKEVGIPVLPHRAVQMTKKIMKTMTI